MIHLKNIEKSFIHKTVMKGYSLHIAPGEKAGLIGSNGSGKTTLLKIISGIMSPDKGEIVIAPKTTITYLPQERRCNSDNTLYDEMLNIFSEVFELEEQLREMETKMQNLPVRSREMDILLKDYSALQGKLDILEVSTIDSKIGKVLSGLGFSTWDHSKVAKHFSGGWQARIELAKILLKSPNLLLLDEPTNHLDLEAIEWLEDYLLNYKGSFIIVSHDRYLLDKLTQKTLEIERGILSEYDGNYSYYTVEKEHRIKLQEEKYKDQQKYLDKSQRFIERFRYKATKARQVKSKEKMLEKIEKISSVEQEKRKIKFSFLFESQSGREVITVKNLARSYDDRAVIEKVNFLVERGERIAITGKNGTGKSTLLKLIAGIITPDKGKIDFGYNVTPAYFSQHQAEALNMENSVMEELRNSAPLSISDQTIRTILGCFLFIQDDVFKKINTLSGGEKARLALARIIIQPSNLLLLDEPTNHLDISSLEVMEEALEDYPGTILFVTHDRFFMDRLADRVFEIDENTLTIYQGNYSYYINRKKKLITEQKNQETQDKSKSYKKKIYKTVKKEKQNPTQKCHTGNIEKQIEDMEKKIKEIEIKMTMPDFYKNPENKELLKNYSNLKKLLPSLYEKWEELLTGV